MGSLDAVLTRQALAEGESRQVVDDTPIAIRLQYKGSGSVTSLEVVTATDVELITSDGGTDTYDFATYTTLGALVDAINADGIFNAKILDSIRSKASDDTLLARGAAATVVVEDGESYLDIYLDVDGADYYGCRLTYDRGFKKPHKTTHRVHIEEIKYDLQLQAGVAGGVKIYEIDGTTETERFAELSVHDAATTINFASGEGKITAKEGNDLVVIINANTALTDDAGNFLRATGIIE